MSLLNNLPKNRAGYLNKFRKNCFSVYSSIHSYVFTYVSYDSLNFSEISDLIACHLSFQAYSCPVVYPKLAVFNTMLCTQNSNLEKK